MTKCKDTLTDNQRQLVSDNHNLIYAYAHKKNIPINDYYDVLAIGLCNAAKSFDESRGRFSTFAFRCMQNELNLCWKNTRKKSAIPEEFIFSYDAPINSIAFDDNSFTKFITDDYLHNEILSSIISTEFINSLTDIEKDIVNLLLKGMTHKEVADVIGSSRQNVDYHLKKIRKKASCLLV